MLKMKSGLQQNMQNTHFTNEAFRKRDLLGFVNFSLILGIQAILRVIAFKMIL